MSSITPDSVPIFILCGGRGTRLGPLGQEQPKPLVEIGDQPLVTHIMRTYSRFGFRRFILCTGHRHDVISSYFLNYSGIANDFTIEPAKRMVWYHQTETLPDWQVTVAQTGRNTMTGGRIARAAARYLGDEPHFGVTYGDGLTDADLAAEFDFHQSHDKLGTVLAVNPRWPFGRFDLAGDEVCGFMEKPIDELRWINGGFFFFRRAFLDYLKPDEDCVLEEEPLCRLAGDRHLELYRHRGFWSCVDTIKDREAVSALYEAGDSPWLGPPRRPL